MAENSNQNSGASSPPKGKETGTSDKTDATAPKGFSGPVCVLDDSTYAVGERVQYQGRILYCAPPGCWLDYGPADPVPLWARDGSGGN
ncbi:hypothetical protein ACTL6U_08670 [Rhodovibrionaceae bacterium A322]